MKRFFVTLACIAPIWLFGQGSQVNTQSQKLVGMAGAGTALFIDESSMVYNPGALVKMDHNAIQIGASGIMFRSTFREYGSLNDYDTKFQVSPPFAGYATFGPKGAWWKAGLAVYTPFGGGVDWGNEWPGRFSLTHLNMRAIYIQPTLSLKLSQNFRIGGGFVYNIGVVELGRSLPVFHPDERPGEATLSGTGTGMGYNLGLHYNLEDEFALSINYRSKVVTKMDEGDVDFDVPGGLSANFPPTTFTSELPLPSSLNVGISFPLSSKVDLAVDGTIINYNIYKTLAFDYSSDAIASTVSDKSYQNAVSGKVGINYQVNDHLALRTGAGYVKTPVLSSHVYPETPDNDRVVAAGGLTYSFSQRLNLNVAYAFQHILSRTTTNRETGLSGAYKTFIHAPGVSFSYNW